MNNEAVHRLCGGLTLTQHGEIEGTPTKAGFWHVVIMVTPEAGEDYANTKEFEITIVVLKKKNA